MLYYGRINVFGGIYINQTSASKECDICHYLYFLNYSYKFQSNVCNRYHDLLMMSLNFSDLLMMSMNFSNIAVLNIKDSDYRCIISLISKNEAINFMQNAELTKKN